MATTSSPSGLEHHPVLSHDAWVAARTALLANHDRYED